MFKNVQMVKNGQAHNFDAEDEDGWDAPGLWDGVMGVKQGKWPLSGGSLLLLRKHKSWLAMPILHKNCPLILLFAFFLSVSHWPFKTSGPILNLYNHIKLFIPPWLLVMTFDTCTLLSPCNLGPHSQATKTLYKFTTRCYEGPFLVGLPTAWVWAWLCTYSEIGGHLLEGVHPPHTTPYLLRCATLHL